MKKTTKIVFEIETDFRKITGKDYDDGDEEDDFTKEVTDTFHNTVFKHFEDGIQENDEFEGEILMQMADDGELPHKVKEFSDMGSVMIRISHEENVSSEKQKLANLIDTWYFEWKEKMTNNREPHSLGFAKEELKRRIELI